MKNKILFLLTLFALLNTIFDNDMLCMKKNINKHKKFKRKRTLKKTKRVRKKHTTGPPINELKIETKKKKKKRKRKKSKKKKMEEIYKKEFPPEEIEFCIRDSYEELIELINKKFKKPFKLKCIFHMDKEKYKALVTKLKKLSTLIIPFQTEEFKRFVSKTSKRKNIYKDFLFKTKNKNLRHIIFTQYPINQKEFITTEHGTELNDRYWRLNFVGVITLTKALENKWLLGKDLSQKFEITHPY